MLTRFHGVFAPNSLFRARVTPAGRGPRAKRVAAEAEHSEASTEPGQRTERASIGWAQRLRRVFGRDVERCAGYGGGTLRIIARQSRIVPGRETILAHRWRTSGSPGPAAEARGPRCRA